MTATYNQDVPIAVLDGSDGMMRVTFTYSPGRDACGPAFDHGGLPAEPPEIEISETRYLDGDKPMMCAALCLAEHEEERVIEWLAENWEPPTGPDPDDEHDRQRDDELTRSPA